MGHAKRVCVFWKSGGCEDAGVVGKVGGGGAC